MPYRVVQWSTGNVGRHALAGMTRTFQTVRSYEELSLTDNLLVAAQEHDGQGWWSALSSSPPLRKAERAAAARAAAAASLCLACQGGPIDRPIA